MAEVRQLYIDECVDAVYQVCDVLHVMPLGLSLEHVVARLSDVVRPPSLYSVVGPDHLYTYVMV